MGRAMGRVISAGLAGLAATGAMTGWMAAAKALVRAPYGEQPPKRIVRLVRKRAGLPAHPRSTGTVLSATVAHLAFGVGAGMLYALLVRRSTAARGAGFGLALWAASYAGWGPASGLMPMPHRDSPHRAVTMLSGHLVYGGVLGAGLARHQRPAPRMALVRAQPQNADRFRGDGQRR